MILRDQKRHNGTLCKSCNKLINTIWDLVRLVTLDFLETSQSPHILFLESTNVKSSVCTTILEVEFMEQGFFPVCFALSTYSNTKHSQFQYIYFTCDTAPRLHSSSLYSLHSGTVRR